MAPGRADFFLLLADGTVADPGALAALASGTAGQAGKGADRPSLAAYLGLAEGSETAALFAKWLALARLRYRQLRWEKLAALSPALPRSTGTTFAFTPYADADGGLAAIGVWTVAAEPPASAAPAALPGSIAPSRAIDPAGPYALGTRDVLALAANPPETVGAFLDDARSRLAEASAAWEKGSAGGAGGMRGDGRTTGYETRPSGTSEHRSGPDGVFRGNSGADVEWEPGRKLFRELHMIKGNAGAFGFEGLAARAQEAEDALESVQASTDRDEGRSARLAETLRVLRGQFDELERALKLIAGEGQEAMARVLKWKLERLAAAAAGIPTAPLEPPLRSLVESSRRLAYLSPAYLARKYRNLVDRLARNLGKQVAFRVAGNSGDVHPESFSRVDEALVHILRNMVDHGIEAPAERKAAGKGEALIELEYVDQDDRVLLRLRDDGRGMDPEAIARRGIALGLLSEEEARGLDAVGKLGIILREGFTTRDEAGPVSGRGLGLTLAARCVADRGGNLYVYSKPGEGARFAIELPPVGGKGLPQ